MTIIEGCLDRLLRTPSRTVLSPRFQTRQFSEAERNLAARRRIRSRLYPAALWGGSVWSGVCDGRSVDRGCVFGDGCPVGWAELVVGLDRNVLIRLSQVYRSVSLRQQRR